VDVIAVHLVRTVVEAEDDAVASLETAAVLTFGADARQSTASVLSTPEVSARIPKRGVVESLALRR